jgi:hypothetical protein
VEAEPKPLQILINAAGAGSSFCKALDVDHHTLKSSLSCYNRFMPIGTNGPRKLTSGWRAIVEVGIIVFLFYSTLLMREFTQTNGQGKSFVFAVADIFTVNTLVVAVISGLIACMIFEYLRKQR